MTIPDLIFLWKTLSLFHIVADLEASTCEKLFFIHNFFQMFVKNVPFVTLFADLDALIEWIW